MIKKTETEPNELERPSFSGVSKGTDLDPNSLAVKARYEKFEKMMRRKETDDDGFSYNRGRSNSPSSQGTRNDAEKLPNEDPLTEALDEKYQSIMKEANVTSEQRIKNILSGFKRVFSDFKVPSADHQKFYDTYLERMIAEKHWKGVNISNVIFHSISSSSQPVALTDPPEKEFHCPNIMCCLVYPANKYNCFLCPAKFTTLADRYVHEWQQHGKLTETNFQCDVSNCREIFAKNPLALRVHYYSKHLCTSEHLECIFGCKALIPHENSRSLPDHVYSVHACETCNDLLSSSLGEHTATFHGHSSSKKYQDFIGRSEKTSSSSSTLIEGYQ